MPLPVATVAAVHQKSHGLVLNDESALLPLGSCFHSVGHLSYQQH